MNKEKVKLILAIATVLVIVAGVILFVPKNEVNAESGVGLKATPRACDFMEFEGNIYFMCSDGFEGKVLPLQPADE